MTRIPTVYESLAGNDWKPISGKGFLSPPDAAEVTTNRNDLANLIAASWHRIIYRRCEECSDSHKDIYYRRWTAFPAGFDVMQLLEEKWASNFNAMHLDFDLYSTYEDAKADTNRWEYCNYDAFGVGFPRECGPTTWSLG